MFGRGCRRRRLAKVDEVSLVGLAVVDQGEAATADPAGGRVGDAGGECRRDGGVDGIAPVFEHLDSRLGRELVLRGHHAARGGCGRQAAARLRRLAEAQAGAVGEEAASGPVS